MIPYGRQQIDESDIAAVVAALQSDYLTTGPLVEQFEQAFAAKVGAKHAVAVCNGTAALHLAMLAAGIGRGDRVVTSPITFLASANCAAYVGAIPDFADIDPVSYTLCPQALEETWKPDKRAVVAVDFAGQAADMPAIAEVARCHGAVVIGIRPGEKLHEVMVTEDDARNTLELPDRYVITPSPEAAGGYTHASPCDRAFRYASDTNAHWLTGAEMLALAGVSEPICPLEQLA